MLYLNYCFKTLRNEKFKLFMNVLGVTISVFIIIVIMTLSESFRYKMISDNDTIDNRISWVAFGNRSQSLNFNGNPVLNLENISYVKNNINVHISSPEYTIPVVSVKNESNSKQTFVDSIVIADTNYLDVLGIKVNGENKKGDAVIGYNVSKTANIKIGDYIISNINGNNYRYQVSGIMEKQKANFSTELIYSYNYEIVVYDKNLVKDKNASRIIVKLKNKNSINSFRNDVEAKLNNDENLKRRIDDTSINVMVVSIQDLTKYIDNIFNNIDVFVLFIILFLNIITIVSISNSIISILYKQKKEIALLKVLGGSKNQISIIILCNTGVITVFGVIFGIILGLATNFIICESLHWKLIFNYKYISISIVSIFFIATLSSLLISMKFSKIKYSTLIK